MIHAAGVPVLAVIATVAILAVVQSLFGVGLLVFGTPTLLLLSIDFDLVLAYLLPCSIVVSTLQVLTTGGLTLEPIRRQFLLWSAPTVLVGTAVTLLLGTAGQIRLLVGIMLVITAAMRFGRLQTMLAAFVRRHVRPLMAGLGLVHGLSNLGGGILTVLVSSCHPAKADSRRHIAFAYGMMACIQLAVVFLTARPSIAIGLWLALPLLAGATYLLVGERAFRGTGQRAYQLGLTGMIGSYGVLILASA